MPKWIINADYENGSMTAEIEDDDLLTDEDVVYDFLANVQVWVEEAE